MTRLAHDQLRQIDYGRMIQALNSVHYAGETEFYGSAPLRSCEQVLLARIEPGARVLDLGCGAGRVTAPTAARDATVVGLDINLPALSTGRAAHDSLPLVDGNMAMLPFAEGSFDRVWCLRFSFNALATEAERRRTLAEMWRCCAPGGSVLIEAFNWHFHGRLGLLRLANLLDVASRRLRWHGQGRRGSPPLPARDILYLANKARGAAPGYAHLTTVHELRHLAETAGLGEYAQLTNEEGVLSQTFSPAHPRHGEYATWLSLRKPTAPVLSGADR